MRLIFDIETNAKKLDQITRVWCVCCLDPDSGKRWQYPPARIPKALAKIRKAEELIGHNIGAYDLPVLEQQYGFQYTGRVVDTLVLSRLIFNGLSDESDQYGRHGLEAWGKRLTCHKGDWSNFQRWDPAMLDYCSQDCTVVAKLLDHLREQKPSAAACRLELDYDAFLRRISRHGFTLDVEGTETLKHKLERRLERLQGYLDGFFPPEETTNGKPEWYSLRLRDGQLFEQEIPRFPTKSALETWRKAQRLKPRDVEVVEGPPATKTRRFNAASPKQVVKGLRSLGWEGERETGSGSISTGESVLWNSGLPAGRLIAAYRGYAKLANFCDQWLKHERDGKLYPTFLSNNTTTGRSSAKSPNVQQIPSSKQRKSGMRLLVPYGKRCRALFKPQDGWELVGSDLAGIEVRLLGALRRRSVCRVSRQRPRHSPAQRRSDRYYPRPSENNVVRVDVRSRRDESSRNARHRPGRRQGGHQGVHYGTRRVCRHESGIDPGAEDGTHSTDRWSTVAM
jgi:DNA polymerase-1